MMKLNRRLHPSRCNTGIVVPSRPRVDSGLMEHTKDDTPDFGDYSQRLGYRLRDLRRERGLSQEAVAHRAGIALYTYQKFEKGESKPGTPMNPTYHTLLSLAWVFDLPVTELLELDGSARLKPKDKGAPDATRSSR